MFVLIVVIYYYMVCLITISIDYKKIMNSDVSVFCRLPKFNHISDVLMDVSVFCRLPKFNHISDVLMDFHLFPVRHRSLNSKL